MNSIQIAFLHLPKSAGTTFRHLLLATLGKERSYYFDSTRIREAVAEFGDTTEHRALIGHFANGLPHFCTSQRVWITFLREPIARSKSYWKHLKRLPPQVATRMIGMADWMRNYPERVPTLSIADALATHACWGLDNGMIRQLASTSGNPIDFDQKLVLDNGDLELAYRHVSKYLVAGLTERLELSIALVANALGTQGVNLKLDAYRSLRSAPVEMKFSESELAIINEHTQLDKELYDRVSADFEDKIQRHPNRSLLEELARKLATQVDDRSDTDKLRIRVRNTISDIPRDTRVVIYGAGEHTNHLLSDTMLLQKQVVGICDTFKHTGDIQGISVYPPRRLGDLRPGLVVVSSFDFQKAIIDTLRSQIGYTGPVLTLYNDDDTHDFHL